MSTTAKIIWALVVVAILGGAYWFWGPRESTPQSGTAAMSTSSPSDTSDRALDQDAAAIDAQMSAAGSDSATVGNTFNDKPVAQ